MSGFIKFEPSNRPCERSAHAVAVNETRDTVYIFGGYARQINGYNFSYFNDLWSMKC